MGKIESTDVLSSTKIHELSHMKGARSTRFAYMFSTLSFFRVISSREDNVKTYEERDRSE